MTADDAQLAAWLAPGPDVHVEVGDFEALRGEIDKLRAADAGEPDWHAVDTLGTSLLRASRKDLRVATYVACARGARDGLSGVVLGMRLVTALLRAPDDVALPTRRRARGLALAWYVEQTRELLGKLRSPPRDGLAHVRAVLDDFDAASVGALGEDAASTQPLHAWLAAAAAPAAAPIESPAPRASAIEPEAALREDALVTPGARALHLAALGRALIRNGRARFAADAADPSAYRVRRLGAALCCEHVPAANKRGRTEVDPPPATVRASVAALVPREAWGELLPAVEQMLDACPLWVEGHFLSAQALAFLGARHAAAHAAVEREARALVARLPGLAAMCFADGSALASLEARRWIEAAGVAAPEPCALPDAEPDVLDALTARVARGEREARVALQALHAEASSGSARFHIRRALAQALEAAGRTPEAALIWRGLAHEAAAHRLARWQPATALSVLRGLERTLGPSPDEARAIASELARHAPFVLLDASISSTISKGA